MVLAASVKESKAEGPDGADQILPAKSANRDGVQLECLCAFTKIVAQCSPPLKPRLRTERTFIHQP